MGTNIVRQTKICCDVLEKLNLGWFEFDDGSLTMPYIFDIENNIKYRVNFCPSCGKNIRGIVLKPEEK